MENAYESPIRYDSAQAGKPRSTSTAPTGLMVLAIFCIILGVLGLMQSTCGSVFFIFQEQINQLQAQGPDAEMQKELAALQAGYQIPNIILTVLNFVVGALLMIGGIGCLRRSAKARGLMRNALLFASIFVLVRAAFGMFMQFSMFGPMQAIFDNQMTGPQAEVAANAAGIAFIVTAVIAAIWALVLIAFYMWGWFYLNKKTVKDYLGTA